MMFTPMNCESLHTPRAGQRSEPDRMAFHLRFSRWTVVAFTLLVLVVDQASKQLAISFLLRGPADFGYIRLRLVANRGILLGFSVPTIVIGLATLAVVVVALRAGREASPGRSLAFGLITGGALGNLIDRFLERSLFPAGAVVDWIGFGSLTFNLADLSIVVGAVLTLLMPARGEPVSGGSPDHGECVRPADSV